MNSEVVESQKDYVPLLQWDYLHFLYDPLLVVSGLGRNFRKKVTECADLSVSPKSILDVGCGTGTHIKLLHTLHPNTTIIGIDPDQSLINTLNNQFTTTSPVSFVCATTNALPFPDNSFDVCFSTLTFHHLTTDAKKEAFHEVYRILKPGGVFIFTDWGVSRIPFFRWLLLFEKQEYLKDHFNGLIPEFASNARFELEKTTLTKFTGIWTWKFVKETSDTSPHSQSSL